MFDFESDGSHVSLIKHKCQDFVDAKTSAASQAIKAQQLRGLSPNDKKISADFDFCKRRLPPIEKRSSTAEGAPFSQEHLSPESSLSTEDNTACEPTPITRTASLSCSRSGSIVSNRGGRVSSTSSGGESFSGNDADGMQTAAAAAAAGGPDSTESGGDAGGSWPRRRVSDPSSILQTLSANEGSSLSPATRRRAIRTRCCRLPFSSSSTATAVPGRFDDPLRRQDGVDGGGAGFWGSGRGRQGPYSRGKGGGCASIVGLGPLGPELTRAGKKAEGPIEVAVPPLASSSPPSSIPPSPLSSLPLLLSPLTPCAEDTLDVLASSVQQTKSDCVLNLPTTPPRLEALPTRVVESAARLAEEHQQGAPTRNAPGDSSLHTATGESADAGSCQQGTDLPGGNSPRGEFGAGAGKGGEGDGCSSKSSHFTFELATTSGRRRKGARAAEGGDDEDGNADGSDDCFKEAPLEVVGGLGVGSYASVLLVRHLHTEKSYAMKVVPKVRSPAAASTLGSKQPQQPPASPRDTPTESEETANDMAQLLHSEERHRIRLRNELKALIEVPSSRFLQACEGAFESESQVFFVLELMAGGDLYAHLSQRVRKERKGFHVEEARVLLAEVVLGLKHLHANGFLHRDVKVENVMLDRRGHVKLVDFGLCCGIDDETVVRNGSLLYMAPELLSKGVAGRFTDWWALGVLAHELLTGRPPWSTTTNKAVLRREITSPSLSAVPLASKHLSRSAAGHLVSAFLTKDYKQRLGSEPGNDAHHVERHAFFDPIDWPATAAGNTAPAFQLWHRTFRKRQLSHGGKTVAPPNAIPPPMSAAARASNAEYAEAPFVDQGCALQAVVEYQKNLRLSLKWPATAKAVLTPVATISNESGEHSPGHLFSHRLHEKCELGGKEPPPLQVWYLGGLGVVKLQPGFSHGFTQPKYSTAAAAAAVEVPGPL